jgi:hypothetical protein
MISYKLLDRVEMIALQDQAEREGPTQHVLQAAAAQMDNLLTALYDALNVIERMEYNLCNRELGDTINE